MALYWIMAFFGTLLVAVFILSVFASIEDINRREQ